LRNAKITISHLLLKIYRMVFLKIVLFGVFLQKKIEYLCALRIETRLQDGLPPKDATGSS
jgi:hypothetical protein